MAIGLFGGGDGSTAKPYLIEDAYDFSAIRRFPTANFKIMYNIDLGVFDNFTPIKNKFTGTIDGNCKVVKNLTINFPNEDNIALFKNYAGTITDIIILNANVTGKRTVGIIGNSLVEPKQYNVNRSIIKGVVKSTYTSNDGIFSSAIGYVEDYNRNRVTIEDCLVDVDIIGRGEYKYALMATRSEFVTLNNIIIKHKTSDNIPVAGIWGRMTGGDGPKTVIYDKTAGSYDYIPDGTNYIKGKSPEEMKNPASYPNWESRQFNGSPTWKIKSGYIPQLYYENKGKIFIYKTDGYYTYDIQTKSWVKQSTVIPSMELAEAKGMDNVDHIPVDKWEELRSAGTIDIVSFIPSAQTVTRQTVVAPMTVASTGDKKTILKSTIKFSDYNNAITKIKTV